MEGLTQITLPGIYYFPSRQRDNKIWRFPVHLHPQSSTQPSICPNIQNKRQLYYFQLRLRLLHQHTEWIWSNKQEVSAVKCESKNKALPSLKQPNPSTQTYTCTSDSSPPPPILLFLADLSPFPLPTVNHRRGCGKLNWGWHWSNGELWPFKQSPETELVNVCTRVHIYPLRFTHNSLPRLCLFGLANGGCHGQSPEPATDLLQVGFWPLSSLRSSPDPWPLTRLILPSTLNRGQGCCWGTRRHGD